MKRYFIFKPIIFLLLLNSVAAYGYGDGDWQNWSRVAIEGDLGQKWGVYLDEEFRIGNNIKTLYFHRTDFGLTYQIKDYFNLSFNYWHSYNQKDKQWIEERRPHINLIFKFKLLNLKFNDRNRIEYRIVQGGSKSWRYRNRLSVTPPLKFTDYNMQPYFADEFYIDPELKELNRNRVYLGCKFKCLPSLNFDFYYLLEMNKSDDGWTSINIVGSIIKVLL